LALGALAGFAGAMALAELMSSLVYQVDPLDAGTLALTGAAMAVTALLATYLPARRASNLDPVIALRMD